MASTVVLAFFLLALSSLVLPDHSAFDVYLDQRLESPSAAHTLGTDELGRSVLFRLIHGARVSLGVAFVAVAVSAAFGTAAGLLAGERGGTFDRGLGHVIDVVLSFPGLLLAVALAAVLGPSMKNTVLALSAAGWVPYARLSRTEGRRVASLDFVAAARVAGASRARLMFRHLLPNVAGPLSVQATLHLAGAIMAESALSFLGLGVPPPSPSWGAMLAAGRLHILDAPHVVMAPALTIFAVVLAANVAGDGLVERLGGLRDKT